MTLEQLRDLAERLPPGGALTLPRDVLLELCRPDDAGAGDLSVEQLADTLGRRPSTVRGWLEAGLFPGAYHLPASGKLSRTARPKVGAWRVPSSAVAAFRLDQRAGNSTRRRVHPKLGDWRSVRPPAGAGAT